MAEGWIFMTATYRRRWGIVRSTARWMPREYNPDRDTWLPVRLGLGLTKKAAQRRSRRRADADYFDRLSGVDIGGTDG